MQNAWWKKKMLEKGWDSRSEAYLNVDSNEYFDHVNQLDKEYKSYWIKAGQNAGDIADVTRRFNAPGGRWSFIAGKAGRAGRLGFASIAAFGFFQLFKENAGAAANIAYHDPVQTQSFETFIRQYEAAIDEVQQSGTMTHNNALHLKDAFLDYQRSLGLSEDGINKIDLALGAWIDLHILKTK
jgi:hypothetical protein